MANTKDARVHINGQALIVSTIQSSLDQNEQIRSYEVTRSGTQIIVKIQIPVDTEFALVLDSLATHLEARVSGISPGNPPFGVLAIESQKKRDWFSDIISKIKSSVRKPEIPSVTPNPEQSLGTRSAGALAPQSYPNPIDQEPSTDNDPKKSEPVEPKKPPKPPDPRGDVSLSIVITRLIRGSKYSALAFLTWLSIGLEPFTNDEATEKPSDKKRQDQPPQ